MRMVTLLQGKKHHRVFVCSIPATGHTLRLLLEGTPEPFVLRVEKVLYKLKENGQIRAVELQVQRRRDLAVPPDGIVPRFRTDVEWVSRSCPPRIGDLVHLRGTGTAALHDLTVLEVIHDINQVVGSHAIVVRVVDASPQRVFSDEAIQRALTDDIKPLFGLDD